MTDRRKANHLDQATIVFDAGAFIAYERRSAGRGVIEFALNRKVPVLTSSAVVAQVWNGSPRQARLAKLLRSEAVVELPFDDVTSRAVGVRCALAGVADVVDGHIAEITVEFDGTVLTSDKDDMVALGVPAERVHTV